MADLTRFKAAQHDDRYYREITGTNSPRKTIQIREEKGLTNRYRADLGLLFEYQFDGRDASSPFTLSDDDLFLAARLAWNDSQDTAVLAGAIIDRQNGSTLVSIEAERRLSNNFKIELEGKFFVSPAVADPLNAFRNDSFLTLRVARFF